MNAICGNGLTSFYVEPQGGVKSYFFKGREYRLNVNGTTLTLTNQITGKHIFVEVDYTELLDCEGNPPASVDAAVQYVLQVIDEDIAGDVTTDNAILTRLFDGAEDNLAVAVGSVGTPVIYEYAVPANKDAVITRIEVWSINPGANFTTDNFCGIPALTNGVIIRINNVPFALWRNNKDIALSVEVTETSFLTQVDRSLIATTNIRSGLFIPRNSKIEALVQDDISALDVAGGEFYIKIQGNLIN